ncbi:D-2-hydroxyacid dehydrogenase [Desulfovibrio litoralis]|uniref:Glycerate dehydrogenase n=1 Tax=Desulfovibrio litoralis DSM 11393 TaxID=1121455 RepID=A0A1M7SMC5_9BACT|nr:D-2-hydroxyacid dehydrogenase [Desulfovibrio litoralis]SHN59625.1 glycerate dehydrogenase [Desulfovibrio litoralis DSM 11393]
MNIVVLDINPLKPEAFEALQACGQVSLYPKTTPEQVLERAKDAEILLTNKTKLNADMINALPNLKYIGMISTGFDVVDINAAKARGIPVCNVPDYSSESVAQHVFSLIFALYRRVEYHNQSVQVGCWERSEAPFYWHTPQRALNGQTIGIVGFGHIGKKIAKAANGFEMNILAYSPRQKTPTNYENFAYAELDELFAKSDIVALSCPLNDSNRGFVNASLINKMKASAIIINTSRGPLINEQDLALALRTGKIWGAGLDVLSVEPPSIDNPLVGATNCILTPHLAWATDIALNKLLKTVAENIKAWQANKTQNQVN